MSTQFNSGDKQMPPKEGAPNRRGRARREEILDAATELFATRGYRGTGMLELAKRVGMSHVGILHHFGTKENLLKAVVERRDKLHDALMADAQGGGPSARILKDAMGTATFMEPEVLTRLGNVLRAENLSPGDPLHHYFDDRSQQVRLYLAKEIRSKQETGEYRSDVDPDAKATEILAFTIGLETQWLLNKDAVDLEKVFASFIRALLDDLTRADAPRCEQTQPEQRGVR